MAVVYETADGPLSDAIEKAICECSRWLELKTMLKRRFGDVIDVNKKT